MTSFLVVSLVMLQFVLAFVQPVGLAYLTLSIGHLPIKFGGAEAIQGFGFGSMSIATLRIFGLWVALLVLITINLGRVTKYISLYRFHLVFLIFVVISISWAPSIAYGLRLFAKLSLPLMVMLLVLVSVKNAQQLKRMELAIVAGALVSMAIALVFQASSVGSHFTIPGMSAAPFSAHLVVVSMLVLATIVCRQSKYALVIMACLVLAVLAAFTRITIGSMFVGSSIILFLALRGVSRFALPLGGIIGLPALFILNDRFRNRMFKHGDEVSVSALGQNPGEVLGQVHGSGRFDAWGNILEKFFNPSPLFGSGAGATQHYFYTSTSNALGVIHSEYVRLISEVGIVGLALFLLAFLVYFLRVLQNYQFARGTEYAKYPLAASGALLSYLIFFATDNGIDYVLQIGNFVFALIAMSEKAREFAYKERQESKSESDSVSRAEVSRLLTPKVRRPI